MRVQYPCLSDGSASDGLEKEEERWARSFSSSSVFQTREWKETEVGAPPGKGGEQVASLQRTGDLGPAFPPPSSSKLSKPVLPLSHSAYPAFILFFSPYLQG